MRIIVSNKAKCKFCGDIIESKHTHNFVTCSCGAVSVDGGHEYLRRCYKAGYTAEECFEDLSEYANVPDNEQVDLDDPEQEQELTEEDYKKHAKWIKEYEKLRGEISVPYIKDYRRYE